MYAAQRSAKIKLKERESPVVSDCRAGHNSNPPVDNGHNNTILNILSVLVSSCHLQWWSFDCMYLRCRCVTISQWHLTNFPMRNLAYLITRPDDQFDVYAMRHMPLLSRGKMATDWWLPEFISLQLDRSRVWQRWFT